MASRNTLYSLRVLLLLTGDCFLFLISLALVLYIRHGFRFPTEIWEQHQLPFSLLLILWIFLLLIADFYNVRRRLIILRELHKLIILFFVWLFLAFSFFYFSPFWSINPKTILVFQAGIFFVLFTVWRYGWDCFTQRKPLRFAILGSHPQTEELLNEIQKKHLAKEYHCIAVIPETHNSTETKQLLINKKINAIVTVEAINPKWAEVLFDTLIAYKMQLIRFSDFFEIVTHKIPLKDMSLYWLLENLDESNKEFYNKIKRFFDSFIALILMIPTIFLAFLVILALVIERKTTIFYTQLRVAKGGKIFTLYKFASMRKDAEENGPQWSHAKDRRVTTVGRFLRRFHLDEIPQLINILKGDMSFIGPRPERPEFITMLQKQIPFYNQRFLVKPGISGWAQLKYPYGENVEDAFQKLQYDLYYIKHRSLLFDLEIALRSLRLILLHPEK